jgi:N-succinyldiaminopimelate aminotransferase
LERPPPGDRLGLTIFAQMTALAVEHDAVNLGQGFPDEDGPPAILEAAADALRAGHNQYAPLPGVPPLVDAIRAHQRKHYGLEVEDVQVTFGATEALASALLGLVAPGDEVLVLDPSYDSYGPIVARAGGTLVPIELEPPDWRVGEVPVSERTRVLLLNSPHNPTGHVLSRAELERLAALCREHDLIAVTDEVYEHLLYDGEHVPLATLLPERTLTISSLGKTHSLTGWKVGWACGPAELVARVRDVKQFLSFAGGTPLQHAAAVGLGMSAAPLTEALRAKRDRLATGLGELGFDVLHTEGTYFLIADAAPLGEPDAEALCLRLPGEAGVAAIPVRPFTAAGRLDSLVRFAFCKREAVLDEALERLARWAG